jgi:hypothetical protein
MTCPLCGIVEHEPENILAEDDLAMLVRTKKLKGHRERLMICAKEHMDYLIWQHYTHLWRKEISRAFDYTYKVIVMEGKYGSVPDHWHLVLTDLEPDADDIHQILGTPWLMVIEIKPWG